MPPQKGALILALFARLLFGQPLYVGQCSAQHELDLSVEAAQFIIRPTAHGVENVRINAEEEWLAIHQYRHLSRRRWVSNQLSAISCQQSAISNQQSAISNQQSAISNQQSAIAARNGREIQAGG